MNKELGVAIVFYILVIAMLYLNRKKFEIQGKIIALYRMKLGLKAMDKIAKTFPRTVNVFAITGIIIGFLGMVAIIAMLIYGAYTVMFIPDAPPAVAPVLPGIPIPGSPITIPLFSGILVIFIVAAVHEFSHGVVARRYGYTVKNTGIVFFGPIIGAFVEPDEKELEKAPVSKQLGIFAAGSFSNIILAVLGIVVLIYLLYPALDAVVVNDGVTIMSVQDGFPSMEAGVIEGEIITAIDQNGVETREKLSEIMEGVNPGDIVSLQTNANVYRVKTTKSPSDESAYLGVTLQNHYAAKPGKELIYPSLQWIVSFFQLLVLISLGIGLFNLAPIGPIDGGRMVLVTLQKWINAEVAKKIWTYITITLLFILAIGFIPFLRAIWDLIF